MNNYRRQVQYYETDMMGITHHSNYIRWMEEARMDYLEQIGFPFTRLEKDGITSPVRSVNCSYKSPTRFADIVEIKVTVKSFNGVLLILGYEMYLSGKTVCTAESEHVFLNRDMRIVRMNRDYTDFYNRLSALVEEDSHA